MVFRLSQADHAVFQIDHHPVKAGSGKDFSVGRLRELQPSTNRRPT